MRVQIIIVGDRSDTGEDKMLMEYYDEFSDCNPNLFKKTVRAFDEYIKEHEIPQNEVYERINELTYTLTVMTKTRQSYRTALRRFVEEISRNYW